MRKCYWKEDDQLTSVTIGKFDGFHMGHQKLLKELLDTGADETVVCKIDLPGPGLLTRREQDAFLAGFGIDRLVRIPFTGEFARQTPEEFVRTILVEKLKAAHVIVGEDFRFGHQRTGTVETLKKLGDKYGFIVHPTEKLQMDGSVVSSTRIRTALEEGRIEVAEHLLGHPICYDGIVSHGRQLGRTIGFPTLNLCPDEEKLLPRFGVYASLVTTPEGEYSAVTNIGKRPTVNDGESITIESNLLHFSGDLYDRQISVRLKSFIRPEQKFETVEALREQMKKDLLFFDFT